MNYKQAFLELEQDLEILREFHLTYSHDSYDEHQLKADSLYGVIKQIRKYTKLIKEDIKTKEDYKFKGWSWWEILEKFDLDKDYCGEISNEIMASQMAKSFLMDNIPSTIGDLDKKQTKVYYEFRKFLKKVAECEPNTYGKVFNAMLEIDDPDVFKQFLFALLGHMWT